MEWNEGLMNSSIKSLREIEEKENLNGSYVRRTLRLAYLSPSTLKAILSESTHPEMNLQKLRTTISLDWVKRYSENM